MQQRQRNVQKSVLLVQSCAFTNSRFFFFFFCRSRYRRRRHCSVSPVSISPQWMPILMKRTGRLLFLAEDRTLLQFLSCTTSTENKQCLKWSQEDENDEKFECCNRKSSRDRLREVAIVVISLGEFWCFG